jgi:hypothetical protein
MPSFLGIMEGNANGLLQHKDELQAILSTENIDICVISEPHFTVNLVLNLETMQYVIPSILPVGHVVEVLL